MDLKITKITKGEKVNFSNPVKNFYKAIGGEKGMRKLMYNFYDKIYESNIAHFFPQDEDEFEQVKIKNSNFFIQICGGPKVYKEAGGMDLNEYMIKFHDDFSINEKARIEWLGTMREALNELENINNEALKSFWNYLDNFSKLTVNSF